MNVNIIPATGAGVAIEASESDGILLYNAIVKLMPYIELENAKLGYRKKERINKQEETQFYTFADSLSAALEAIKKERR